MRSFLSSHILLASLASCVFAFPPKSSESFDGIMNENKNPENGRIINRHHAIVHLKCSFCPLDGVNHENQSAGIVRWHHQLF